MSAIAKIETVEQLEDLPKGSVVRSSDARVLEKTTYHGETEWWQTSSDVPDRSDEIELPALLIWHPDEAAQLDQLTNRIHRALTNSGLVDINQRWKLAHEVAAEIAREDD